MCLFSILAIGQNAPDCRIAIPVCADGPIIGVADGSGDIDDFDPEIIRESGCLEKGSISSANIENNTSWLAFRAGIDGEIGFDIETLSLEAEWDFAVYGPYDETQPGDFCAIVGDGTVQPVRCNFEINNSGFTGLGVNPVTGLNGAPSPDGTEGSENTYDQFLDVLQGEIYYIFINNFRTPVDEQSFVLTFTGVSVDADQNTALDCAFRDEFLGLDKVACEGDPDIVLSARRSPAGAVINSVVWEVDFDDDGVIDQPLTGTGAPDYELTVAYPNSGRYFVTINTPFGQITDEALITYYTTPVLDPINGVTILENNLSLDYDFNDVEFLVDGDGDYEYAINGDEFQDSPIFLDVPPGENTVIISDKNGCGTTEAIPFLVVGYPKFFSPNGDMANELWNIRGIETLTDPVVSIFDRYGKLLTQLDETAQGWDGTFNGKPMPASDYWFKFEYDELDGAAVLVAKTTRKHFSLIR